MSFLNRLTSTTNTTRAPIIDVTDELAADLTALSDEYGTVV